MLKSMKPFARPLAWRAAFGAAALALIAGCAQTPGAAPEANAASVQRLGQMFQTALPIGRMADMIASQDRLWPFQGAGTRNKVTAAQRACVRGEMTGAKVAAQQMDDAREYAAAHPERLADDLKLLEQQGAAATIGRLMMEGARSGDAERAGVAGRDAMSEVAPGQAQAMMSLLFEPRYEALRKAMRLDVMTRGLMAGRKGQHEAGMQIGASLMLPPLLSAMEKCKVPMSVL